MNMKTLLLLRNNGINHLVLELLTNFYYTWLDIWIQKVCKNCPKVSDQNTLRIHGYGITAQKLQNIMMHRFVLFLVHHTPSSCFWIFSQLTFFEKSQLKFIVWKKKYSHFRNTVDVVVNFHQSVGSLHGPIEANGDH